MRMKLTGKNGRLGTRKKESKLLIWAILIGLLLNFSWDLLDRQDDVKYLYNKVFETIDKED
jgi:hypothetical protein